MEASGDSSAEALPGSRRAVKIAVCEADDLTPEGDAGSRAVADLIERLRALGHEVAFFAEAAQGLAERVAAFDPTMIFVSRPGLFARLQPLLAPLDRPLLYLAHDLHYVRVGLQAEVMGGEAAQAARVLRFVEARCFSTATVTLLPTHDEVARARQDFPAGRFEQINYFAMPPAVPRAERPDDFRVVFVGGQRHAPNYDGVRWFCQQVWPAIRRARPDAEFWVIGDWGAARDEFEEIPGVRFLGSLSDADVDDAMRAARWGAAPLRFGAGMKRKTLHYLAQGLPVVGTSFAVEGVTETGVVPGVVRAESADEWIATLLEDDDASWRERSRAAADFINRSFSAQRQRDDLARALRWVG